MSETPGEKKDQESFENAEPLKPHRQNALCHSFKCGTGILALWMRPVIFHRCGNQLLMFPQCQGQAAAVFAQLADL